jgi:hypothetical protein
MRYVFFNFKIWQKVIVDVLEKNHLNLMLTILPVWNKAMRVTILLQDREILIAC